MQRKHHRCSQCGKVSYFRPDEPVACRACGAPGAQDPASHDAPAAAAPDGQPDEPVQEQEAGGATGLGIASIALALFALASIWVAPFSALLALGALVTGILTLSSANEDESAARAVAIVAIVIAALVMLLAFLTLLNPCFPWGCDVHVQSGGGQDGGGGGSGDGGGSGGGGGSSGGEGSGGGGGSSGGGGGGGSGGAGGGPGGGGADAPGAGVWWAALLLLAAGVRRR